MILTKKTSCVDKSPLVSKVVPFLIVFSCLATEHHGVLAATLTVSGVPYFDITLGTLTSAVVTVDPEPRRVTSLGTLFPSPENEGEHRHLVTLSSVTLAGREISFPTTYSDTAINQSGTTHSHVFDIEPFEVTYEGDELRYLNLPCDINSSVCIVPVAPDAFGYDLNDLVQVEEALGHTHRYILEDNWFWFSNEATTTFEFTPIPEPATGLLMAIGLVLSVLHIGRGDI